MNELAIYLKIYIYNLEVREWDGWHVAAPQSLDATLTGCWLLFQIVCEGRVPVNVLI